MSNNNPSSPSSPSNPSNPSSPSNNPITLKTLAITPGCYLYYETLQIDPNNNNPNSSQNDQNELHLESKERENKNFESFEKSKFIIAYELLKCQIRIFFNIPKSVITTNNNNNPNSQDNKKDKEQKEQKNHKPIIEIEYNHSVTV